jgi:excinuclease UvrABC nuclease subunit
MQSVALHDRRRLPRKPGVYYAFSMLNPLQPLYIGMSGNLNKRWNSEANPHHKFYELRHRWFVRLFYVTMANRHKAEMLESFEIRAYKPILNRRDEMPERWGWRYRLHQLNQKATQAIAALAVGLAALSILYWVTQR